jgi:hypothetical protein
VTRYAVALGCLAGGVWLHFAATISFGIGLFLWMGLAAGIGFMLPRLWVVALAPAPWLVGVLGGVMIGQHESLGDVWFVSLVMSVVAGVIGMVLGAAIRGGRRDVSPS